MVGGQVEDLAWERESADRTEPSAVRETRSAAPRSHSLEALENIHAHKTGALFRACLRLGAWSARGERSGAPDPEQLQSLDGYGRCFGQAFQITDDLLDVEGTSAQTGKRVNKDAGRGKLTYPGFLGIAESRKRAEQLCQDARRYLLPFGQAGERLAALTGLLLDRKR
jgi:geranylgeranyl diphosphate synthase type II